MAGNKPMGLATSTALASAIPNHNEHSADLFSVFRRLAARYRAKAEYLAKLALVSDKSAETARSAARYANAVTNTEALIG